MEQTHSCATCLNHIADKELKHELLQFGLYGKDTSDSGGREAGSPDVTHLREIRSLLDIFLIAFQETTPLLAIDSYETEERKEQMPTGELHPVYDEEGMETPYLIDAQDEPYLNAYVIIDDEPRRIARIRRWDNNVAPYEDLDTGTMHDSVAYLCAQVTDYQYEQY